MVGRDGCRRYVFLQREGEKGQKLIGLMRWPQTSPFLYSLFGGAAETVSLSGKDRSQNWYFSNYYWSVDVREWICFDSHFVHTHNKNTLPLWYVGINPPVVIILSRWQARPAGRTSKSSSFFQADWCCHLNCANSKSTSSCGPGSLPRY